MVNRDTQTDSDMNQNAGTSEADERIRKEVYKLLEAQPQIDTSKLEVRVENGEAILVGIVQSEEQRTMLEDLVASVQGVTDVQDALDLATDIREEASRISQEDQGQPSAPM
ncbi:BON domain-containing protein [Oligoflexus tunisiensis]|uniref:BON domain-containing protein n=1 Tax=Oligoflexus tunisiensis TaxID=708132 RepID=UPI00114CC2E6|nr:BON domain-containing protein [Oligoflexus tunisiensis]